MFDVNYFLGISPPSADRSRDMARAEAAAAAAKVLMMNDGIEEERFGEKVAALASSCGGAAPPLRKQFLCVGDAGGGDGYSGIADDGGFFDSIMSSAGRDCPCLGSGMDMISESRPPSSPGKIDTGQFVFWVL